MNEMIRLIKKEKFSIGLLIILLYVLITPSETKEGFWGNTSYSRTERKKMPIASLGKYGASI